MKHLPLHSSVMMLTAVSTFQGHNGTFQDLDLEYFLMKFESNPIVNKKLSH